MDTTQNTPAKPTAWRAILITLLIFGCGDLGFAAGIFAGVAGRLSLYNATVAGAGTFLGTLAVGIVIMIFIVKGDGG